MNQRNLNLLLSLHKRGISKEVCLMNAVELMVRTNLVDFAETIVAFFDALCEEKISSMMQEVATDPYELSAYKTLLKDIATSSVTLHNVKSLIEETLQKYSKP